LDSANFELKQFKMNIALTMFALVAFAYVALGDDAAQPTSNNQPSNNQPSNGQPSNGQPSNGQPSNGQPTNDQSSAPTSKSDSCGSRKHGDWSCKDKHTTSICAYGETYDYPCPPDFVCQTQGQKAQVQCTKFVRADGSTASESLPDNTDNNKIARAPEPGEPTGNQGNQGNQGNNNSPRQKRSDGIRKSDDNQLAAEQTPQRPDNDDDDDYDQEQDQSAQKENNDCATTVDGRQETLKNGDRICKGETAYDVCAYGILIGDQCPTPSKCIQQPRAIDGQQRVQCREIRRNAPQPTGQQ